jgi:hypothetical protein
MLKLDHKSLENLYETIDWEIYVNLCNELTSIDETDIEGELSKQSTLYSYFTGLLAYADNEVDKFETFYNQLESMTKESLYSASTKKLTVAQMESAIGSNEELYSQRLKLIGLEYKAKLFSGLVRSLSQRKDMLVQISSNKKAENKMYSN